MSAPPTLRIAASLALAAIAVAGCGSSKNGDSLGSNPNDQRAQALACLEEENLEVRKVGPTGLQVGAKGTGPRVAFYTTPRDAEADQFEGKTPGAEQVGRALIYVNEGSDEVLEKLENCLDETT